MKQMIHGRTLIESLSTNQGMFSTKTRINRVWKYLGASLCSWVRDGYNGDLKYELQDAGP